MNYREKIKEAEKFIEEQQEKVDRNAGNYNYDDTDGIRTEAITNVKQLLKVIECLEFLGGICGKE
jgi:hypothetical protein